MRNTMKQQRSRVWLWTAAVASGLMLAVAASAVAQEDEEPKAAAKAPAAKAKPAHAAAPAEKAAGRQGCGSDRSAGGRRTRPCRRSWRASRPPRPSVPGRPSSGRFAASRPGQGSLEEDRGCQSDGAATGRAGRPVRHTMFLDLASQPDLCPEAKQLADAVVAANGRQLQDPKRLAKLIKQLQDPAEDVRAKALAGLQDARGAGVEALVGALAGGDEASRTALVEMGTAAAGPMLAVLAGGGPAMKVRAIQVSSIACGCRKRRPSCWRRMPRPAAIRACGRRPTRS